MPKKKRPEEDPKKQFERFVEAARDVKVDQKAAERAFKEAARGKKVRTPPENNEG